MNASDLAEDYLVDPKEAMRTALDCTPDNGQTVKQWYLRQPPFRTESEICSPELNAASFGCTHLQ